MTIGAIIITAEAFTSPQLFSNLLWKANRIVAIGFFASSWTKVNANKNSFHENKKVIIPRSDFVFRKDDRVVFIVKKDSISFVENIFRLSSV